MGVNLDILCIFEQTCVDQVCATVLASGQLGGFGGQWERQGGAELVSQRRVGAEEKKVTVLQVGQVPKNPTHFK